MARAQTRRTQFTLAPILDSALQTARDPAKVWHHVGFVFAATSLSQVGSARTCHLHVFSDPTPGTVRNATADHVQALALIYGQFPHIVESVPKQQLTDFVDGAIRGYEYANGWVPHDLQTLPVASE